MVLKGGTAVTILAVRLSRVGILTGKEDEEGFSAGWRCLAPWSAQAVMQAVHVQQSLKLYAS